MSATEACPASGADKDGTPSVEEGEPSVVDDVDDAESDAELEEAVDDGAFFGVAVVRVADVGVEPGRAPPGVGDPAEEPGGGGGLPGPGVPGALIQPRVMWVPVPVEVAW